MIIPGFIITMITFPGVIVHEAGHLLFCKLRKVAVFDVCFFQLDNPAGYVLHETPKDFLSTFLICIGPLILNTLLCILFCFPAFVPVRVFDRLDPVCYFLLWLGVSIGMHAFPSFQDATILWNQAIGAAARGNLLAIVSFPVVVLIFLANILSFFWFDLWYGVVIGLFLPEMLYKHIIS